MSEGPPLTHDIGKVVVEIKGDRLEWLCECHSSEKNDTYFLGRYFGISLFYKMTKATTDPMGNLINWETLCGITFPSLLALKNNMDLCMYLLNDVVTHVDRDQIPLMVDDIEQF